KNTPGAISRTSPGLKTGVISSPLAEWDAINSTANVHRMRFIMMSFDARNAPGPNPGSAADTSTRNSAGRQMHGLFDPPPTLGSRYSFAIPLRYNSGMLRKRKYLLAPVAFALIGVEIVSMVHGKDPQVVVGGAIGALMGACLILFLLQWANHRDEPG